VFVVVLARLPYIQGEGEEATRRSTGRLVLMACLILACKARVATHLEYLEKLGNLKMIWKKFGKMCCWR